MKKVSIIGLGWLGMPLALALLGRGYQVTGSKTTDDGVEAARLSGVDCYRLRLTPEPECEPEALAALLQTEALIVTLPPGRTAREGAAICRRYSNWSTARWRLAYRASSTPVRRRCTAPPAAN